MKHLLIWSILKARQVFSLACWKGGEKNSSIINEQANQTLKEEENMSESDIETAEANCYYEAVIDKSTRGIICTYE